MIPWKPAVRLHGTWCQALACQFFSGHSSVEGAFELVGIDLQESLWSQPGECSHLASDVAVTSGEARKGPQESPVFRD